MSSLLKRTSQVSFLQLISYIFPKQQILSSSKLKELQTTISNLLKMAESSPNRQKTLWEKEKLLVTSNFSFSHSVFKGLVLQTCKNQGLFGKGLTTGQEKLCENLKLFDKLRQKTEQCDSVGKFSPFLHVLSWVYYH